MINGSRVLVLGVDSWGFGTVEDIRPPDDLIDIPLAPPVAEVRRIMREWRVQRVAVISLGGYLDGVLRVFVALGTEGGGWRDLKGQPLDISEA